MNTWAGGLDVEDGSLDFQHQDQATEAHLVPLQSVGTGNPRHSGLHNVKEKYRKCAEKCKEVARLCTSLAAEHSTENIMGNYGLAITKEENHLFSIQLLPSLTYMRERPPPGVGDPAKLTALPEEFWHALVPWLALAPHMANAKRTPCCLWSV